MTSESNKLKDRGNAAFKDKKFEKAIDLFKKAIEIEEASPSKDAELLAVLQSNIAQVYLELKVYDEAAMFANLSISNDPSFLKSVLRRGIAQFELGHYAEATVDLRSVLKVDPKHLKSIQFMRQITGPELNSEAMRSAYLRHYFRRLMITLISAPDRLVENTPWFNQCMLRSYYIISSNIARSTKYFWSNGSFICESDEISGYFFRSWFVSLYFHSTVVWENSFGTEFNAKSLEAVFAIVQPENVSLLINCLNPSIEEIRSICNFDAAFYKPILDEFFYTEPSQRFLKGLKTVLKHLTAIPCVEEIMRLSDSNFAQMDTLVLGQRGITWDFLNFWEQREWPIEKLIIHEKLNHYFHPDAFDVLSVHVREKVKSLSYIFICDSDPTSISDDYVEPGYRDLTVLKHAFPSISEFLGTFIFVLGGAQRYHFFRSGLKEHIRWLLTGFDAEKVRFGDRPKVVSWIKLKFKRSDQVDLKIEAIKLIVKECRQEVPQIESITFSQSKDAFDWIPVSCSYAVIDIKAKGIDFQVAFLKGCKE